MSDNIKNIKVVKNFEEPTEKGQHYRFDCMTGPNKGISYYLKGERILIGRSKDVDIQILDVKASKLHVELILSGDHYILTDLNSHNGVIINDEKVIQQKLFDGDKIIIGQTVFRYNLIVLESNLIKIEEKKSLENRTSVATPKAFKKKNNKNKRVMILSIILIFLFFLMNDGPKEGERVKRTEDNDKIGINPGTLPLYSSRRKYSEEDRELEKKVKALIHRGLREFRERNYYRAIDEFNHVLIFSPNHDRASFYLRKTKQALDEEINMNFLRARRDADSIKYKSAAVSYCSILRLLQGYDDDQRYKDAQTNLNIIEERMGLDPGEITCL